VSKPFLLLLSTFAQILPLILFRSESENKKEKEKEKKENNV